MLYYDDMHMAKRKIIIIISVLIALPAVLLLLFLLLFDMRGFAESKIKAALKASVDAEVKLKASNFGLLSGRADSLDINARNVTRFPIELKELKLHLTGIKVNPLALGKQAIRAVETLHAEGTLVIDEAAFSRFLQQKAPKLTEVEARFVGDRIKLTITTAVVRVSLTGTLAIENGTKVNLQVSDKESTEDKGLLAGALGYINPLVDFERINLAPAFRSLPEEEKKKWEVRVTHIKVEDSLLTIGFTAAKKP